MRDQHFLANVVCIITLVVFRSLDFVSDWLLVLRFLVLGLGFLVSGSFWFSSWL